MSSSASHPRPPGPKKPRRSPPPGQRQRDPERTRARILDAAAEELSEKGVTGVRVGAIADRAGVNKQLISYYFGGKDGLLRALGQQWRQERQDQDYDGAAMTLPEVFATYVRVSASERVHTRVLGWEGLTYSGPADDPDHQARAAQAEHDVADLRRRQEEGELAADLDPACMLLAFMGACAAHVLLPHIAHSLVGAEAESPEFTRRYAEQISRLAAHLAEPTDPAAR